MTRMDWKFCNDSTDYNWDSEAPHTSLRNLKGNLSGVKLYFDTLGGLHQLCNEIKLRLWASYKARVTLTSTSTHQKLYRNHLNFTDDLKKINWVSGTSENISRALSDKELNFIVFEAHVTEFYQNSLFEIASIPKAPQFSSNEPQE